MKREPLPLSYETRTATARSSRFIRWSMYSAPLVVPIVGLFAATAGLAERAGEWPTMDNILWVAFGTVATGVVLLYAILGVGVALAGPAFLKTGSTRLFAVAYVVALTSVAVLSFRFGRNLYF